MVTNADQRKWRQIRISVVSQNPQNKNPVRRIPVAVFGQGAARDVRYDRGVQAQQLVQPLLHVVSGGVADRLVQGDLVQHAAQRRRRSVRAA